MAGGRSQKPHQLDPDRRLRHIPLWSVYPAWGWGTETRARALDYLKRFGSVTVLNGHIHQIMQKSRATSPSHTAMSTGSRSRRRRGTLARTMKVATTSCARFSASTDVTFNRGQQRLAIIDQPLQGEENNNAHKTCIATALAVAVLQWRGFFRFPRRRRGRQFAFAPQHIP